MSEDVVTADVKNNIGWITLNRPKNLNTINLPTVKRFYEIVNEWSGDTSVRAVVITGQGDAAFCAGGDVGDFAAKSERVGLLLREMTTYFHTAISRLSWMNAPVIAAVNGVAAGAGLSLVACSDIAIAADSAKFTSAYTHIGLSPDGSSSYFLPRLIGRRRASELFLTNRSLNAQEALDWGLVNEVVAAKSLRERVEKVAQSLAAGPTRALGSVKKLLLLSSHDSLESQMERETRRIVDHAQSPDGLEGVKAFVERRKPVYQGH